DILLNKIVFNTLGGSFPGIRNVERPADEAGDFNVLAFDFLGMNAVVPDVNVGGNEQLTEIGRICKDLLVPGHPGIKAKLTGGGADDPGCLPIKYGSIFQQKNGLFPCLILHVKVQRYKENYFPGWSGSLK